MDRICSCPTGLPVRLRLAAAVLVAWCAARAPAQTFAFLHRQLPADTTRTMALAAGDVDGDGDLDVLVGNDWSQRSAQNRLYGNDGQGLFTDVTDTSLPRTFDGTCALALFDADGDGDLDAFVGNDHGEQNRLLRNDGGGLFTDVTGTALPQAGDDTRAVAAGDVDGDGDLDLVVGNYHAQNRLLRNDGTGRFTDVTATGMPVERDVTQSLALGDVDGDGDLDLLVGNSHEAPNRLCRNDGHGVFTFATTAVSAIRDITQEVALADVDGDGDLDVWTGVNGQDRLWRNDGAWRFVDVTATCLPGEIGDTHGIAVGDVDGDGDPDLLAADWRDGQRLMLNDGTGRFTVVAWPGPRSAILPSAVLLVDVDGDGDCDALVGGQDDEVRLLFNDGAGRFAAEFPASFADEFGIGDFDGDGDPDLVTVQHGEQNGLYLNDGTGGFVDATSNLPVGAGGRPAVACGDVDGDGDLDLLVVHHAEQNRLYLNDGSAHFVDATSGRLPTEVTYSSAVALGDLDGDGDLDALVGSERMSYPAGSAQNQLYLNDGAGVFTNLTATHLPVADRRTWDVVLVDVDGDLDLDVVTNDELYLNDGRARFTDVSAANLQFPAYAVCVAAGDVDGDGDADLMFGSSAQAWLYRNDGRGMFTDVSASSLPSGATFVGSIVLWDLDGDGDRDALLGTGTQDRLYRNDGTGRFTAVTSGAMPALTSSGRRIRIADVDRDGDVDALVLGSVSPVRVLTNVTHQLARRQAARPGRPLAMDLHGAPGALWVLDAAVCRADVALPPLGVLQIDPACAIVAGWGNLDTSGRATWQATVPAAPALVGTQLFWQGCSGPPLRLTNLEITVFQAF